MLKEIRTRGDIVLFIDEIHTLVGAGAAEGAIDAARILKPMLARGELQTIGATTLDEYRKYLEKDAALERRFQPIQVAEPSIAHTIEMLKGLRDRYEAHHRVTITDEALVSAATLADRYISDRFLPDKAIDLIDEAGSRLRIRRMTAPADLREYDDKIAEVRQRKEAAIDGQDFEAAAKLRDEEKQLTAAKVEREKQWRAGDLDEVAEVDEELIAEVLAVATGIPIVKLSEEESTRLLKMEDELHKRVIGQDQAVAALSRAIRRTRAGLKDPKRPGGSFIFAGPSGVGKTWLSKTLAEFLFGDEDALIQLDMSEFSEKHTVSRLFGSPPGYVGYEEGGQLTEKVRRKPFSVVLFDEVEKAHPDIFNSLLQILEEGRLTDSQGRVVDFKNTVIIMTTNLGTKDIAKGQNLGFAQSGDAAGSYERMKNKVQEELKQHFRPEFLNRVDEIIVFPPLSQEQIVHMVDNMIAGVELRLKDRDMSLELTQAAKNLLATRGFDPVLGARPLRRTIQREIEDTLAEKMLYGEVGPGQIVLVGVEGEGRDRGVHVQGPEDGRAARPAAAGDRGRRAVTRPCRSRRGRRRDARPDGRGEGRRHRLIAYDDGRSPHSCEVTGRSGFWGFETRRSDLASSGPSRRCRNLRRVVGDLAGSVTAGSSVGGVQVEHHDADDDQGQGGQLHRVEPLAEGERRRPRRWRRCRARTTRRTPPRPTSGGPRRRAARWTARSHPSPAPTRAGRGSRGCGGGRRWRRPRCRWRQAGRRTG